MARPSRSASRGGWPPALLLSVILLLSCGGPLGKKVPCDGLVYKEYGLSRTEYLPCAGEMIATMDRMRPEIQALLSGDRSAESRARAMYAELGGLIKSAGGRNLLERWEDSSLSSLNVDIWNAYTHYQAGFIIPVIATGRSGATQAQEARADEFHAANDRADQAKNVYEGLR